MSDIERPWPRFTAASTVRRREVDPAAPWPRWGSLPERATPEAASMFEGPGLAETVHRRPIAEPVAARAFDPLIEGEPQASSSPTEPVEARVIPRAQSTALVPVRQSREVALADVARAVRRASPVIAVASVAAVAAMAFFRRR